MGLINVTQQAYYSQSQQFTATGSSNTVTITTVYFPTLPAVGSIAVFIDGKEINTGNYSYNASSGVITFTGNANNTDVITFTSSQYRPNAGLIIEVKEINKAERFGNYRYTSLNDLINNYLVAFVGDGKIIDSAKKTDVMFHAQRGIQEFAYDISRVEKIQEIELGPSLAMPMPNDYVNYVKISWVDDSGIERLIMPTRLTSKASQPLLQDEDFNYMFDADGKPLTGSSIIDARFKDFDTTKITGSLPNQRVNHSVYDDSVDRMSLHGARFGLTPETTTENAKIIFKLD